MTYTNGFGFTNCGPTGCGTFNGFSNCGPVSGYPVGYGSNYSPIGYGNCGPTGCGYNSFSPTGYGFHSPIGFGATNYGFNNYGFNTGYPTTSFNPGFTGQFPTGYPTNFGWNTTSGFGFPISGTSFNTPWNFSGGFSPISNWNGTPSWNNWNWNTLNNCGADSRFFSGAGYNTPITTWGNVTPWNCTTPWSNFGGFDTGSYGFNPFLATTPWGFNPSWNMSSFGTPSFGGNGFTNSFNGFGANGFNTGYNSSFNTGTPSVLNGYSNIPTIGTLGLTSPITNSFPGYTGYPVSTFGQNSFTNSTPWTSFGGQFPFAGIPFNTTGYSNMPFNTTGYNTGWQNGFGFNGSTNGQGPVFGQGYSNSPFSSNGGFQNYPFNNGTPVNNGTIGLNREAA